MKSRGTAFAHFHRDVVVLVEVDTSRLSVARIEELMFNARVRFLVTMKAERVHTTATSIR